MPTTPKIGIFYPVYKVREWYDSYKSALLAVDQELYAAREDRNLIISGGGTFSFSSGTLTWSSAINIFSPVVGFNCTVPAGNIAITDASVVYVTLTRAPTQNVSLTFSQAANLSLANGTSAFIFGIRQGSLFYVRNGRVIANGESFSLLQQSSITGGSSGNLQAFTYTCSGSESDDFMVTLPAARSNDTYKISASKSGGTTLYAFDVPNTIPTDRTTTQFRVTTALPVTAGDTFDFIVVDAT